ncbi:MAG: M48 family metallopeptidase [Dehalococcoidia bacterium]|nr:M48 family metallopeptidase [Dehalococcoidia bacterium]
MFERDRISAAGTVIHYEVHRSKRRKKTLQITVDGQTVRVAVPWKIKTREAREFVRKHAAWIIKSLSHLAPPERRRTRPESDSVRVEGTTIKYEVIRSRRLKRTFRFSVERGAVWVEVPWDAYPEAIRSAVRIRAPMIISQLSQYLPKSRRKVTERDSVRVAGTTIEYEVHRSSRRKKSVQIRVERGVVLVVVPSVAKSGVIRRAVRDRAEWILNKLSQAPPEGIQKRFVNGESLPYLGEDVRIVVRFADVPSPEIRLDDGRFRVAVPPNLRGKRRLEAMRQAFIEWYRERALDQVTECVDRWWPKLGRGGRSRVLIRNQRRRWGSCASDGTIRINWRVIMLEPSLIEYIVVHELAHLSVRNHSPDFKKLMASVLPDFRDREKRLGQTEGILPL